MDDLLQWGAVVAVLIAVAIYFVRKMTRKGGQEGCSGCGLNGLCKKDDCCDRNDNAGKDREKQQKQ